MVLVYMIALPIKKNWVFSNIAPHKIIARHEIIALHYCIITMMGAIGHLTTKLGRWL